jgi:hypothetical protein
MVNNPNARIEPIITQFCGQPFVSVRVDNVDYYPISQLPFDPTGLVGFPVPQNHAVQSFKRLLGESFSSHKIATTLNSKKVDCISEETLALSVKQYARKHDSEFAWTLLEASFAVQLKMTNDVGYGVETEVAYYVELAAMRAEGIKYRRLFTDLVKMQKELGFDLNYGYMTLLIHQYLLRIDAFLDTYPSMCYRVETSTHIWIYYLPNFKPDYVTYGSYSLYPNVECYVARTGMLRFSITK